MQKSLNQFQTYFENANSMTADNFVSEWLKLYATNGYLCLFGMDIKDSIVTEEDGHQSHKYKFFCNYNKLLKPNQIEKALHNIENVNLHWSAQTFGFRKLLALPPRTTTGPMTPEERAERRTMPKQLYTQLRRGKSYVQNLESLIVDVDLKDSKIWISKEEFLKDLPDILAYNNIPVPTMIVDSGHGFHLYWKIHSLFFANNIYLWTLISKFLCAALSAYGADAKIAGDSSRVLKLPGTINRKPNKEDENVKGVLWSGIVYSLDALAEMFYITRYDKEIPEIVTPKSCDLSSVEECKESAALFFQGKNPLAAKFIIQARTRRQKIYNDYITALHTYDDIPEDETFSGYCKDAYDSTLSQDGIAPALREYHKKGIIACEKKFAKIFLQRREDLETLIHLRDYEDSGRETILFLYRYNECLITKDAEAALNNTMLLNNSLANPLSEDEIMKCTISGEIYALSEDRRYKFSNKWIVEKLAITNEESQNMKQLLTEDVKNERRKKSQQNQYLKRTGKEAVKENRQDEFNELMTSGITSCAAICKEMNISRSTFYRMKKVYEENLVVETTVVPEAEAAVVVDNEVVSESENVVLEETNESLVQIEPKNNHSDIFKYMKNVLQTTKEMTRQLHFKRNQYIYGT